MNESRQVPGPASLPEFIELVERRIPDDRRAAAKLGSEALGLVRRMADRSPLADAKMALAEVAVAAFRAAGESGRMRVAEEYGFPRREGGAEVPLPAGAESFARAWGVVQGFLRARGLYAEAQACFDAGRFAEAEERLAPIAEAAEVLPSRPFDEQVRCLRRRIELADPAKFPKHAEDVLRRLANNRLAEADALCEELVAAQSQNPDVAELVEAVNQARAKVVQSRTAQAEAFMQEGKVEKARAIMDELSQIAKDLDLPPSAEQLEAELLRREVPKVIKEAKKLAMEGAFAPALHLIDPMLGRELLDEGSRGKLESLRKLVCARQRDAAADHASRVKESIGAGEWVEADLRLTEAESKGHGGAVAAQRRLVDRCLRARDELDEARRLIQDDKPRRALEIVEAVLGDELAGPFHVHAKGVEAEAYARLEAIHTRAAMAALEAAWAHAAKDELPQAVEQVDRALSYEHAGALLDEAAQLRAEVWPKWQRSRANYQPDPFRFIVRLSMVAGAATIAFLIFGPLLGLVRGIALALLAAFAFLPTAECLRKLSLSAHNGRTHYGALTTAGWSTFILTAGLEVPLKLGWPSIALGVAAGILTWGFAKARLRSYCPAITPPAEKA